MIRQVQMIQKMLMQCPSGAAVRRRSARSRLRWCEHGGSDVQEVREDPGRRDFQQKTEFQQKSEYRVQQKTAPQAFKEGSTKPWWNSEMGTPACTRETERLPQHAWMATAQQCKRRRRRWTQQVLPRTTTTLVVLKASGTTLW